MLLGIAGGFATKKEKKKMRWCCLLQVLFGVIGVIQIVPLFAEIWVVPEVGFEPTKHFAAHLECALFDHSTPA